MPNKFTLVLGGWGAFYIRISMLFIAIRFFLFERKIQPLRTGCEALAVVKKKCINHELNSLTLYKHMFTGQNKYCIYINIFSFSGKNEFQLNKVSGERTWGGFIAQRHRKRTTIWYIWTPWDRKSALIRNHNDNDNKLWAFLGGHSKTSLTVNITDAAHKIWKLMPL